MFDLFFCHSQVEVSDLLTVNQLGQLAATPSQLTSKQVVAKIMTAISPTEFDTFFDIVSPAVEVNIQLLFLFLNQKLTVF